MAAAGSAAGRCRTAPSSLGLYGRIHGYEEEGEGESTRSALMRSDDGRRQLGILLDARLRCRSIVDYEEPAILRLKDGRLVCFPAHPRQSVGTPQRTW